MLCPVQTCLVQIITSFDREFGSSMNLCKLHGMYSEHHISISICKALYDPPEMDGQLMLSKKIYFDCLCIYQPPLSWPFVTLFEMKPRGKRTSNQQCVKIRSQTQIQNNVYSYSPLIFFCICQTNFIIVVFDLIPQWVLFYIQCRNAGLDSISWQRCTSPLILSQSICNLFLVENALSTHFPFPVLRVCHSDLHAIQNLFIRYAFVLVFLYNAITLF